MRFFIKRNDKFLMLRQVLAGVALAITGVVPVSAEKPGDSALTARSVFEHLTAPSLDVLKPTTRLDMLDYWDADSVYQAKNALNGISRLENVTPDYLKVNITPVSDLQIKLLKVKGGNVVMTIYTTGGEGQARDSRIDFYDAATLAPLETSRFFIAPDLKVFFNIPKGSSTTMKEISEMIPFMTVEYEVSADNDMIKGRLTSGDFLNVDNRDIVKTFLRPEVTGEWKGKYKFK